MRYYSKIGMVFILILLVLTVMLVVSISDKDLATSIILVVVLSYLLWMCFSTYYMISNGMLNYRSALLKGSIDILTIRQVLRNKTVYSGIKASLSTNGLIIKYNKWDDVYLSPKDAELFVNALTTVNSDIEVL